MDEPSVLVERPDSSGVMPLDHAIQNQHDEAVAALLRLGARVDRAGHDGLTGLMRACQAGRPADVGATRPFIGLAGWPCTDSSPATTRIGSPDSPRHRPGPSALYRRCGVGWSMAPASTCRQTTGDARYTSPRRRP